MLNPETVKDEKCSKTPFEGEIEKVEDTIDSNNPTKEHIKYISNLEDLELVLLAKDGDEDSIERILRKYKYLIKFKSQKYFAPGLDRDDLYQEGSIGLYNSIRDFKMDAATPFRAFCELCIERQIITAVKTATRQKHQPLNKYVSFDKPVYEWEDADRTMHDTLENQKQFTPEDIVIDRENIYALLTKLKDRLSPFEAEVFERQLLRLSYQEIANQLGRHVKSIDNAMQRVRDKVDKARAEINDELEG